MRASSDPADPGYDTWVHTFNGKCDVFLDGVKLKECMMADEEMGEALIAKVDEAGNVVFEGDEFVFETMRGKVEIRAA